MFVVVVIPSEAWDSAAVLRGGERWVVGSPIKGGSLLSAESGAQDGGRATAMLSSEIPSAAEAQGPRRGGAVHAGS